MIAFPILNMENVRKYAAQIQETRLSRLSKEEIEEVISIRKIILRSLADYFSEFLIGNISGKFYYFF